MDGSDSESTKGSSRGQEFLVGVMTMEIEGKNSSQFHRDVTQAVDLFQETLSSTLGVSVQLLTFQGPHLLPTAGAYEPLDFLRIGMTEKLERDVHFLLIVTEVDLTARKFSYTLALPSQLTNVGVVSTKRLDPAFWGQNRNEQEDAELIVRRLTTVLLHTFGHLLNLPHVQSARNVMHDFSGVGDLTAMVEITEQQRERLGKMLPAEAHERTSCEGHWRFALRTLVRNWRSIGRAVMRANPLRLLTRLPTMITAALSVILIVFFSPEMWDVASTVELYQLVLFAVVAVITATAALYRAFAFGGVLGRGGVLAESTVVTGAATALNLVLTILLLFAIFMALSYLGTLTIFPQKLMETWPTVDPAVRTLDHVKLSVFVATLGVLAGSLGGRADSRNLVRGVLFLDEET